MSEKTISTQEKRELSKIVQGKYQRLIGDAQQNKALTEGELFGRIAKKFKVDAIDNEIASLQEKIRFLETKKSELGFGSGYHQGKFKTTYDHKNRTEVIDPQTPAGRVYYSLVKQEGTIAELENQKDNILTQLWLTSDRSKVEALVNEKPKLPKVQLLLKEDK